MRNASHRFWLFIAAALAVSLIAVPAASAGVHKYNTKVGFTWEGGGFVHAGVHGVESKVRKCEGRRRVFKQRPGAAPDRRLATTESDFDPRYGTGNFGMSPPKAALHRGETRLYVKVKRKVLNDGDVCRGTRSETKTY
jgi:hypothetical protein